MNIQRIKIYSSVFILFNFFLSKTSHAENLKLNLAQTLEYAIKHYPDFNTIERLVQISTLDEDSAIARQLPSLDLTATHGILNSDPKPIYSPYESDFKLSLTENIYDNGVNWTNHKIASLNKQITKLSFQDQKNKLTLDISTQFISYSLSLKLIDIQEKQYELIKRQYEIIARNYAQGLKTKNDYIRLQTQVKRYEISLNLARTNALRTKEELKRLIGSNLNPNDNVEFIPLPLENVKNDISPKKLSVEDHLQYKITQLQKRINDLNADIIARRNLPEWYLSAGVNYGSSNYYDTGYTVKDNQITDWNLLLTIKYNIFDWGIRSNDKTVALNRSQIQSNDIQKQLLTLQSTLNQLVLQFDQITKNFSLAKDLLNLEKSNIEYIEKEYRNGKLQYLDLISALNNLADAKTNFFQISADLQTAKYNLLYHQGHLYEELK